MTCSLHLLALLILFLDPLQAFVPVTQSPSTFSLRPLHGATVAEPQTREKTDRKTGQGFTEGTEDKVDYPDLEYLIDSAEAREMEDPFHILLMQSTFDKPKITISYVAGSLEYVLAMPYSEAVEQSRFAKQEGFSCLGTWPREECLALGRKLQMRDIVCRVVPYVEGGQRGWQAKDASQSSSSSSNSDTFFS